MASMWKRPEGAPLPTVYRRFAGSKAMPDGRTPNFWIQEVTSDLDEEIVDFMCDSFLKEENFCSLTRVREDPVSLEEIRVIWRTMLQQRAAIVAFTDWPDGPNHPRVAGANMTCVTQKGEHLSDVSGVPINTVLRALHHVEEQVDVFERYGVGAFLNALGLSVAPAFRGQDVGRQLLMARDDLMRAVGLRLTVTVFTGVASQKQAARAGFELLAEQRYDDYRDEKGQLVFPVAPCDVFQLMAKFLE